MSQARIPFYKMSGSGNDFILVDNRNRIVDEENLGKWIALICRRRHSVGADGLILVEDSNRADFRWRFFNADGGQVEMCGNGGRCVARLAHLKGIAGPALSFETEAGIIRAEITGKRVKLEMPQPSGAELDYPLDIDGKALIVSSITIGVPHVVIRVNDIEKAGVFETGRQIRYHKHYVPEGTNVNFVQPLDDGAFAIRTYERGVEDETLACGTGSVAAALIASIKGIAESPVTLHTRGNEILKIHFEKDNSIFRNVFLEGDTKVIYEGSLWKEAAEE